MLNRHLVALHGLYGEYQGVRIARKHVGWTLDWLGLGETRRQFNQCQYATEQFALLQSIVQGQKAA